MTKIFISYSHKNLKTATRVYTSLQNAGFEPWMDKFNIRKGERWDTAIQRGLNQSSVMALLLTPSASGSTHVNDEWFYFLEQQKVVIPLKVEPLSWPEGWPYRLIRLQYIDFVDQPFESAIAELIQFLVAEFEPTPTPPTLTPKRTTAPAPSEAELNQTPVMRHKAEGSDERVQDGQAFSSTIDDGVVFNRRTLLNLEDLPDFNQALIKMGSAETVPKDDHLNLQYWHEDIGHNHNVVTLWLLHTLSPDEFPLPTSEQAGDPIEHAEELVEQAFRRHEYQTEGEERLRYGWHTTPDDPDEDQEEPNLENRLPI